MQSHLVNYRDSEDGSMTSGSAGGWWLGGRGRVGDERMPREGCTGRMWQGRGESFQAEERVEGIKYRDV